MSEFFAKYPEVYNGDNATIFLNGDGYDKLKDFLSAPTDRLVKLLKKSVPVDMYQAMGLLDKSWVDELVGETGVLSSAVERYADAHRYIQWGEADFTIFHPAYGFIVFEVKDGQIAFDRQRGWIQINRYSGHEKIIDPMETGRKIEKMRIHAA